MYQKIIKNIHARCHKTTILKMIRCSIRYQIDGHNFEFITLIYGDHSNN